MPYGKKRPGPTRLDSVRPMVAPQCPGVEGASKEIFLFEKLQEGWSHQFTPEAAQEELVKRCSQSDIKFIQWDAPKGVSSQDASASYGKLEIGVDLALQEHSVERGTVDGVLQVRLAPVFRVHPGEGTRKQAYVVKLYENDTLADDRWGRYADNSPLNETTRKTLMRIFKHEVEGAGARYLDALDARYQGQLVQSDECKRVVPRGTKVLRDTDTKALVAYGDQRQVRQRSRSADARRQSGWDGSHDGRPWYEYNDGRWECRDGTPREWGQMNSPRTTEREMQRHRPEEREAYGRVYQQESSTCHQGYLMGRKRSSEHMRAQDDEYYELSGVADAPYHQNFKDPTGAWANKSQSFESRGNQQQYYTYSRRVLRMEEAVLTPAPGRAVDRNPEPKRIAQRMDDGRDHWSHELADRRQFPKDNVWNRLQPGDAPWAEQNYWEAPPKPKSKPRDEWDTPESSVADQEEIDPWATNRERRQQQSAIEMGSLASVQYGTMVKETNLTPEEDAALRGLVAVGSGKVSDKLKVAAMLKWLSSESQGTNKALKTLSNAWKNEKIMEDSVADPLTRKLLAVLTYGLEAVAGHDKSLKARKNAPKPSVVQGSSNRAFIFKSGTILSNWVWTKLQPEFTDGSIWSDGSPYGRDPQYLAVDFASGALASRVEQLRQTLQNQGFECQFDLLGVQATRRDQPPELFLFVRWDTHGCPAQFAYVAKSTASSVALGRWTSKGLWVIPGGGQSNIYPLPQDGLTIQQSQRELVKSLWANADEICGNQGDNRHRMYVSVAKAGSEARGRLQDLTKDTGYGNQTLFFGTHKRAWDGEARCHKNSDCIKDMQKGIGSQSDIHWGRMYGATLRYYETRMPEQYYIPAWRQTSLGVMIRTDQIAGFVKGLQWGADELME